MTQRLEDYIFRAENLIGKGTSRTVYADGDRVVKRVHGEQTRFQRGLAQNRAEYELYKYATNEHGITCLCPIFDITPDDERLHMGRAIPVNRTKGMSEELRAKTSLFRRKLFRIATSTINARRYDLVPHRVIKRYKRITPKKEHEDIERLFNGKLFHDIVTLHLDYQLMMGDIRRPSSWGYYKGRFVLIDYGGTESVLTDHYNRKFTRGVVR